MAHLRLRLPAYDDHACRMHLVVRPEHQAASHNDTEGKTPYIIQSTLILLAPILFAASIYMILGRLIRRTDSAEYSLIRVNWLTKIFVGGDILCLYVPTYCSQFV